MKKSLLLFFIMTLTAFGLKKYSFALFSPKKVYCAQTNTHLSDDYFTSIKNQATQLVDKNYSAHYIITHLKKEFPILTKIVVAYRPCGTYIMLHAHKPLCCINDNLMLTADHELYPKDFFATHLRDSLAQVTVAPEYISKAPSLVSSLLHKLPLQFNDLYDLEICNEHYIHLTDKKDCNFSIIASIGQEKMKLLLEHCAAVKKTISERKDFGKAQWVADIRFADYIIAHRA